MNQFLCSIDADDRLDFPDMVKGLQCTLMVPMGPIPMGPYALWALGQPPLPLGRGVGWGYWERSGWVGFYNDLLIMFLPLALLLFRLSNWDGPPEVICPPPLLFPHYQMLQ